MVKLGGRLGVEHRQAIEHGHAQLLARGDGWWRARVCAGVRLQGGKGARPGEASATLARGGVVRQSQRRCRRALHAQRARARAALSRVSVFLPSQDARDLVLWCTQPRPEHRPASFAQILRHAFLAPPAASAPPRVDEALRFAGYRGTALRAHERYHFFLSHNQSEAGDMTHTLYEMLTHCSGLEHVRPAGAAHTICKTGVDFASHFAQ